MSSLAYKKYWLLGFFLLENFLFGGTLYGWDDFVKFLKKNDLFTHQCPKENGYERTCYTQESMFFLLYTVCALVKALSGVFTLQLLKKLKLKYVRILPLFFIISGGILMAYTTDSYPRLIYSGAVLISLAGGQLLFCSFSVADLFPTRRCTVISLCCGAFCASHAIFYLFQVLEETFDLSYCQIFIMWSASAVIILVPNVFLLKELHPPTKRMYAANVARMFAKTKRSNKKKYRLLEDAGSSEDSEAEEKKSDSSLKPNFVEVEEIENQIEGFRSNNFIASIPFFLHVWWASVLSLVLTDYSKDLTIWMEEKDATSQEVSQLKLIWQYGSFAMFFIAPISGIVLDYSASKVKEETDLGRGHAKRLGVGSWVILLTTLLVTSLLILKFISIPAMGNVVLYVVAYATTTTVTIAYLSIRFPWEVFQNLLSVLWLVTYTFGLVEFPLQTLNSISPLWSSIILMIMMTSSFVSVALPFVPSALRSFDSVSVIST